MIGDISKLAKETSGLKRLHRYSGRSVKKFVCLHVFLVGRVVSPFINSKEELQRIVEWSLMEGVKLHFPFSNYKIGNR
jgi:hypothetical protein